jgi:hypothetical protein
MGSRRTACRFILILVVFIGPCASLGWAHDITLGSAHDMITVEHADMQLALIAQNVVTLKSAEPALKRAEAAYQIGRRLDEIAAFLNRDIASHGEVQGQPANQLVNELKARGTPLARVANGLFLANVDYYRQCLTLAPQGPREADALFKLTQGYFFDRSGAGPLNAKQRTWEQLQEQILLGERLTQRYPAHGDAEEARFILLVHYVQAAKGAPNRDAARTMAQRAQAAINDFLARYPTALRAAALPLFREALVNR